MFTAQVERIVQKWFEARPILENIIYRVTDEGGAVGIFCSTQTSRGKWSAKECIDNLQLRHSQLNISSLVSSVLSRMIIDLVTTTVQPVSFGWVR